MPNSQGLSTTLIYFLLERSRSRSSSQSHLVQLHLEHTALQIPVDPCWALWVPVAGTTEQWRKDTCFHLLQPWSPIDHWPLPQTIHRPDWVTWPQSASKGSWVAGGAKVVSEEPRLRWRLPWWRVIPHPTALPGVLILAKEEFAQCWAHSRHKKKKPGKINCWSWGQMLYLLQVCFINLTKGLIFKVKRILSHILR